MKLVLGPLGNGPMRWALACGFAFLVPGPAWAWGPVGHRAVATMAHARLSSRADRAVRELLDPGETLADASLWADAHRRDLPESAPWHYVNVPLTASSYDPKYCPTNGCVVSIIGDLEKVLRERARPRAERQRALRLLVHFIEDLHQPVHVGNQGDRGGNDLQLRFFGAETNLHRLWDEGIVDRHSTDEAQWASELEGLATPEAARAWAGGDAATWATESLAAARVAYQDPASASPLRSGVNLGNAYYAVALPVAQKRLAQAGVRLASELNALFE